MKEPAPKDSKEEFGYPWPCMKCGKIFTPRRTLSAHFKWQPYCSTCAMENLMKFMAMEDSDEQN